MDTAEWFRLGFPRHRRSEKILKDGSSGVHCWIVGGHASTARNPPLSATTV